mmetsp:Transcript_28761/g.63902  ORF Transcript_28761/g.63902 Transcript_28761/m.63902 type:complete len:90 (+) Transcript_28761:80-349(+)
MTNSGQSNRTKGEGEGKDNGTRPSVICSSIHKAPDSGPVDVAHMSLCRPPRVEANDQPRPIQSNQGAIVHLLASKPETKPKRISTQVSQ